MPAFVACLLFQAGAAVDGASPPTTIPVTIETAQGPRTLQAEVACTLEERGRGLMGRVGLAPDTGMIFLVPVPRPIRMWMKDTPLSLDLIFFDSDGRIRKIESKAEPMSEQRIESGGAMAGVLELAGGYASELKIQLLDKILYDYPEERCE